MDAKVHEAVFGEPVHFNHPASVRNQPITGRDGIYSVLRRYSTDIAAAWQVIEALNGPRCGHWLAEMLQATTPNNDFGGSVVWQVELRHTPTGKHVFGIAPSLPEAVCKAALKAAEWV